MPIYEPFYFCVSRIFWVLNPAWMNIFPCQNYYYPKKAELLALVSFLFSVTNSKLLKEHSLYKWALTVSNKFWINPACSQIKKKKKTLHSLFFREKYWLSDVQHFYLLAEVEEAKDKPIYKVTRQARNWTWQVQFCQYCSFMWVLILLVRSLVSHPKFSFVANHSCLKFPWMNSCLTVIHELHFVRFSFSFLRDY